MCGNPRGWAYLMRKKSARKILIFHDENWFSKILKSIFFRDCFLKNIFFRNIEMFDEKIVSGFPPEKSKFSKMIREICFHWKFRCSEKILFAGENIDFFFDLFFLKIDFRHEKLIFFFQIFSLTRYSHPLGLPHI